MMTAKRPTETREQRARTQYHAYRFSIANVLVKSEAGSRRVGVVTVSKKAKPAEGYAVALLPEGPRCTCMDFQRRGETCKHGHMALLFLTGNVPPLPAPGFDPEVEGAILAKLEESERLQRAARDRDRLWEDHAAL